MAKNFVVLFTLAIIVQTFGWNYDIKACEKRFNAAILPSMQKYDLNAFQVALNESLKWCYDTALAEGNNKEYIKKLYREDVEPYPMKSGVTAPITEHQAPEQAAKNTAIACCALCDSMSRS